MESDKFFKILFDKTELLQTYLEKEMIHKRIELYIQEGKGDYKGLYYVEISNISAKNLDTMYYFSISNGTEDTTAKLGPMGYAYWALSSTSTSESLKYAMMGLYHYTCSAKEYFN